MRQTIKEQKQTRLASEFLNWLVIFSVVLFVVNNWWLKYEFHNWVTGKLSDFLFCFFFPLYCSAFLSVLTGWKIRTRLWIGVCITLVSFVTMKTSPSISSWVSNAFTIVTQAAIGQTSKNVVDPTDLIAIPAVLCSVFFVFKTKKKHIMSQLLQGHILSLSVLILVIPFLIGHGANPECLGNDNCVEETGPVLYYEHTISGSADPTTNINIGSHLDVSLEGSLYTNPDGTEGSSIPPILYENTRRYLQLLYVTANKPDSGGDTIGEMWIHSNDMNIKLIHSAVTASYLNAIFEVRSFYFGMPQSSVIDSSDDYTLSSGITGSDSFLMYAPVEIYLNNISIFSHSDIDNAVVLPFTFSASPGDNLRIVVGGSGTNSTSITSIWLHTPEGNGIKLSHLASNRNLSYSGVFMDLSYTLP